MGKVFCYVKQSYKNNRERERMEGTVPYRDTPEAYAPSLMGGEPEFKEWAEPDETATDQSNDPPERHDHNIHRSSHKSKSR